MQDNGPVFEASRGFNGLLEVSVYTADATKIGPLGVSDGCYFQNIYIAQEPKHSLSLLLKSIAQW